MVQGSYNNIIALINRLQNEEVFSVERLRYGLRGRTPAWRVVSALQMQNIPKTVLLGIEPRILQHNFTKKRYFHGIKRKKVGCETTSFIF